MKCFYCFFSKSFKQIKIYFILGDPIFTAGKPAIFTNNTLIRKNRQLTNKRHRGYPNQNTNNLTSSSSTISSASNNIDREKEYKELIKDKEKEICENPIRKFTFNSGESLNICCKMKF